GVQTCALPIFELVVESAAGDAEGAGGGRDVALVVSQRAPHVALLDLLQRELGVERRLGLALGEAEVGRRDELAARQHGRPLDGVLELADVAGPAVALEGVEGLGREPAEVRAAPRR